MTIRIALNPAAVAAQTAAVVDAKTQETAGYALVHCKTSHRVGNGYRRGDLARSYRVQRLVVGKWQLITDSIFYAGFVEYGTRHMAAQRHVRDAGAAAAAKYGGDYSEGGA